MPSPRQRAANRANALKSTGPRSAHGKVRAKLNATKHGLSLPVDEHVFADQIRKIAALVRGDCDTEQQANELAKRIIDFERNEAFLQDFNAETLHDEISAWARDPHRMALAQLAQASRNKQPVPTTFTLRQKGHPVRLKGKERTEEIKFIEGFLGLVGTAMVGRVRAGKESQASALRYQRRAINQQVKGIRTLAKGEEL